MAKQPKRILVAEDDRFLAMALQAQLVRSGFDVIVARDGEQALNLARTEAPHLILLDLIMPKLQGFEVLRLLKQEEKTASIPVIVLSNLGQEIDLETVTQAGAQGYFVKSRTPLKDIVNEVVKTLAEV